MILYDKISHYEIIHLSHRIDMKLMKEALRRMTLGRYATKPVCVCDLLGARSGRCARVVFAGEGWDDFVKHSLHAFKSHQPSFSYQRSLLFSRNLHFLTIFCHNRIDLHLYCTCR